MCFLITASLGRISFNRRRTGQIVLVSDLRVERGRRRGRLNVKLPQNGLEQISPVLPKSTCSLAIATVQNTVAQLLEELRLMNSLWSMSKHKILAIFLQVPDVNVVRTLKHGHIPHCWKSGKPPAVVVLL